jgi:hypothetical protein
VDRDPVLLIYPDQDPVLPTDLDLDLDPALQLCWTRVQSNTSDLHQDPVSPTDLDQEQALQLYVNQDPVLPTDFNQEPVLRTMLNQVPVLPTDLEEEPMLETLQGSDPGIKIIWF